MLLEEEMQQKAPRYRQSTWYLVKVTVLGTLVFFFFFSPRNFNFIGSCHAGGSLRGKALRNMGVSLEMM